MPRRMWSRSVGIAGMGSAPKAMWRAARVAAERARKLRREMGDMEEIVDDEVKLRLNISCALRRAARRISAPTSQERARRSPGPTAVRKGSRPLKTSSSLPVCRIDFTLGFERKTSGAKADWLQSIDAGIMPAPPAAGQPFLLKMRIAGRFILTANEK